MIAAPGSGKSTYVKKHYPTAVVASADLFFTDKATGQYKFDMSKIGAAHAFSKRTAETAMSESAPVVVIDNTNVRKSDIKPYLELASKYGYITKYVHLAAPLDQIVRRGLHNVPETSVAKMKTSADSLAKQLSAGGVDIISVDTSA